MISSNQRHYINGVEHIEVPHPYSSQLQMLDLKRARLTDGMEMLVKQRRAIPQWETNQFHKSHFEITNWIDEIKQKIKTIENTREWLLEIGQIEAIEL